MLKLRTVTKKKIIHTNPSFQSKARLPAAQPSPAQPSPAQPSPGKQFLQAPE